MAILRSSQSSHSEPHLFGADVWLRPPQVRDWRAWAELRAESREFLAPWEPTWPDDTLSRSSFRRRLRRQLRDENDDLGYAFFLFRQKDDALLGGLTLTNVQRGVAQSCSVGYWIGKPHAHKGYMTQGLCCVLAHCFDTLKLHRVEAACMPGNTPSQALLARCGFRREGYALEYLKIDGTWRDHVLYAVLDRAWRRPSWLRPGAAR